jgi:hypothetical protein
MFTCPHCHQRAMGAWAKMKVSVYSGRTCQVYGKRVYASKAFPISVFLASLITGFAANRMPSHGWAYATIEAGGVALVLVQIFVIPLVSREKQAKGNT